MIIPTKNQKVKKTRIFRKFVAGLKRKRRDDLDKIGRAKPSLWAKYATANLVLKVMKTFATVNTPRVLSKQILCNT